MATKIAVPKELKLKATGHSFDGCHELDQHDNEKWFALGGEDIQVWGTDWVLLGTREAIDYIASVYELSLES